MNLKIVAIKDGGDPNNERVVLKAVGDCNTGDYILIDTTRKGSERLIGKVKHPFIFPSEEIREGEFVRVYTKVGTYSTSPAKYDSEGNLIATLNHNFYWGIRGVIWNNGEDSATLMQIADRQSFRLPPDKY